MVKKENSEVANKSESLNARQGCGVGKAGNTKCVENKGRFFFVVVLNA